MKLKLLRLFTMAIKLSTYGLLLQVFFMSVLFAHNGNAQYKSASEIIINKAIKELTIKEAFDLIESNSELEMLYLEKDLNRKVRINLTPDSNRSVYDILMEVSKQSNLKFRQVNNGISASPIQKQEEKNSINRFEVFEEIDIAGRITDENNQGLPGASVLIKGTINGTTTDLDGNYKLSVPEDATLAISFVGYTTQEIVVGTQSTIDLQMEVDASQLEEIIVVGYGKKEKKEVVGSVAQVSGDIIKKNPAANFASSLAGRLPGLIVNQPGSEPGRDDPQILIRGKGTFGDNSVLIVIDGVIGRDGLSRLDPQDIESVTVLKDASAAIYGSRAANGVILVTTKRGVDGKAQLSYSFNQTFSTPNRYQKQGSALTYAEQINANNVINGAPPTFSDTELTEFGSSGFQSTDWWREVYGRTSVQSRHSLSLRGGREDVKYFFSLGKTQQEGVINRDDETDVGQYNFRSNIDVTPTKGLNVSFDVAGRREHRQYYGNESFNIVSGTANGPFQYPATVDGKVVSPTRPGAATSVNPLALVSEEVGYKKQTNTIINSTLRATYEIPFVQGLSVGGWAAVDVWQNYHKNFNTPFSQYYLDSNEDLQVETIDREITLNESYFRQQQVTLNANIGFQRTFSEDHRVNTFLSYEQSTSENNGTTTARDGFISPQVDQLSAGSAENQINGSSAGESARQNYLGRFGYTFKDKYIAEFLFRYDGSFNFPKGKRFGFFPGASVAWRISEEAFLKENNVINNLKFRASWSETGNDRIAQFQFLNRFGLDGSYPFGAGPELVDETVLSKVGVDANPNITWETSEKINFGVEASFLNNRLTVELDVFKEKRSDILASRNLSVPGFTGISAPQENIGKTENKGFEAIVGYNTHFGEVSFGVDGNMAYAKNKLIFKDAVPPTEGNEYQNLEGQPIGSRLMYNTIGIYRTQGDLDQYPGVPGAEIGDLIYADTNGDEVLDAGDRIAFDKTVTPEVTFGLNLRSGYKGFELSVFFQGQANANLEIRSINGTSAYHLNNSWTVDTPEASLPRLWIAQNINGHDGGTYANTFWQRSASFVRLKTMELAYNLPSSLISKVGVQNLRVYISGTNLLTFDGFKKDGLADPEQQNALGWSYPHQRLFNLGVNVTF